MQNKISKFLKRLSLVTTHPNEDWLKIFVLLMLVAGLSLGWNIYFYLSVQKDIETSVAAGQDRVAQTSVSEKEKMGILIEGYDQRASVHSGVVGGTYTEVADPAGA